MYFTRNALGGCLRQFEDACLEEELYGLRDEIDRVLLLPDRPVVVA